MPSLYISITGLRAALKSLDNVGKNTHKALETALYHSALSVEGEAKRLIATGYYQPAIDEGTLRDSVFATVLESVPGRYVTSATYVNVYYAIYVHDGTKRMQARPFIHDALENKQAAIEENIRVIVRQALA